jgi:hypothetical protein
MRNAPIIRGTGLDATNPVYIAVASVATRAESNVNRRFMPTILPRTKTLGGGSKSVPVISPVRWGFSYGTRQRLTS